MSKASKLIEMLNENDDIKIDNPNTSGQGHSDTYKNVPFLDTLTKYGFTYSHSTPITGLNGKKFLHHTFKAPSGSEYAVGAWKDKDGAWKWEASSGTGSGHRKTGYTIAYLERYLLNLKKRKKI